MAIHWREDTIHPNPHIPEPWIDPAEYEALKKAYDEMAEKYDDAVAKAAKLDGFVDGTLDEYEAPETLTRVRNCAFTDTAVRRIKIGQVPSERISWPAFHDCPELVGLDINSELNIGAFKMNNDPKLLAIRLAAGATGTAVQTFQNCALLPFVEFPEGTQGFGRTTVFVGCPALEAIVLPSTVTTLNTNGLSNLKNTVCYCKFPEGQVTGNWQQYFKKVVYDCENLPADDPDAIALKAYRDQRDAILDGPLPEATVQALETAAVTKLTSMMKAGLIDTTDEELASSLYTLGVIDKMPATTKVDTQPVKDAMDDLASL